MDAATVYRPPHALDVRLTLSALRRGAGDPTHVVDATGVWRTALTPDGSATLHLSRPASGAVVAAAWGPGARWLVGAVPDLLGARDDPRGFLPAHRLLREAAKRHAGLRLTRTGLVFEMLVPAVLEQKVTGVEARRSWRELIVRHGLPAPGPAPQRMRVFPPPDVWRRLPSWEWHRSGVDGARVQAIAGAAAVAGRLERTLESGAQEGQRVLRSIAGVGAWTAAEVIQRSHGDPDAVSVGDYHIPALVGWALSGRAVDDDGMLRLLAPYRPHRHRCVRLLELSEVGPPRRGPRLAPRDYRAC
ncbi:MAG: DNA-3-methyladenine glycosylase family protein [Frankiaceae bacterium]